MNQNLIASKATMPSKHAPWCDLHEETLELIFKCLNSLDLLTCRYVCASWRSTVKRMISNKPSLKLTSSLFFPDKRYNSTELYRISLPVIFNGRNYISSCRGWILSSSVETEVAESSFHDLQLFNPATEAIITLPQLAKNSFKSPFKLILPTSPAHPNSEIYLLDKLERLASWKRGKSAWSVRVLRTDLLNIDDIIFRRHGDTRIEGCKHVDSHRTTSKYLVESSSGDLLLMVTRYLEWEIPSPDYNCYRTRCFQVRRRKKRTWKKVTSLGDEAIFLQHYDSRCVSVRDSSVYKPNCIYFLDDSMEGYYTSRGTDVGVYDLESKTIQQLDNIIPFNKWFTPEI